MKDYSFKPYKICKGKKRRRKKHRYRLYRLLSVTNASNLCDLEFTDKNKVRFISQFMRWFIKDPTGFRIETNLKKIKEGDVIHIGCWTYKAAWKNLFLKLGFKLIDYKKVKRRKYFIYYTFFFSNFKNKEKKITLDINITKNEIFNVFITLDSFFINFFDIIIENSKV